MSTVIENAHLAGLIVFPILAVSAILLFCIRAARGESLFRELLCHPHAILHPQSLFRSDSMKNAGMVHVPQFLATWKRYRALYMGVVGYLVVMVFYYALLWSFEGVGLRPSGELVDFGRWIAYTIIANIAMTVLCHLLYVHKGQYYFVRLFGTLAPVMLLFSTFVVTTNGVIILFVASAVCTAFAFLYILPGNYLGRHRYRNKWRSWGNRYFWFGMSILGAYAILGLVFLLVDAHLLTSVLGPDGEAVANVVVDIVIAVYVLLMVSLKFFTDKLNVYTDKLTTDHYTDPSGESIVGDESIPILPSSLEPREITAAPSFRFKNPTRSIMRTSGRPKIF